MRPLWLSVSINTADLKNPPDTTPARSFNEAASAKLGIPHAGKGWPDDPASFATRHASGRLANTAAVMAVPAVRTIA